VTSLLSDQFLRLQDYLLEFYPPEHPVTLVVSKTFPLQESLVETYRLKTLAVELERGPQAGTLYIPPLRHRPIEDREVFEKLAAQA
jgi:hypothetical protein